MKIGVPETIRKENFQDFFSFSKPKLNENLKFHDRPFKYNKVKIFENLILSYNQKQANRSNVFDIKGLTLI